jgi:hypothetical protein
MVVIQTVKDMYDGKKNKRLSKEKSNERKGVFKYFISSLVLEI